MGKSTIHIIARWPERTGIEAGKLVSINAMKGGRLQMYAELE